MTVRRLWHVKCYFFSDLARQDDCGAGDRVPGRADVLARILWRLSLWVMLFLLLIWGLLGYVGR
jgi:hypothetical protein